MNSKKGEMVYRHPNISEEGAAIQRREALDTKPQDRYGGRFKFEFCHRCGSQDGMQSCHYECMIILTVTVIELLAPWFSEPGNDAELFYPCHTCNRAKIVPLVFDPLGIADVLAWVNERDPMAPDWAALAAEPEAALASIDSRESAGI